MMLLATAATLAALAVFALGQGRRHAARRRAVGGLLLALSPYLSVLASQAWCIGLVAWFGLLMASHCLLVFLLPHLPRYRGNGPLTAFSSPR